MLKSIIRKNNMYQYVIKKDGFAIGQRKGKKQCFDYIQALLKEEGQLGIWKDLKCETDMNIYTIERE